MQQHLFQKLHNATTIEQVIYLINNSPRNICVIFIPAWAGLTQIKNFVHRNPHPYRLCVLLCDSLFYFEAASIAFAISRFLLM